MGYNDFTNEDSICYYVRVSSDEQESSISNQVEFFENHAKNNNISNYKIYIDEALTGTDTKKRKSFNEMVLDLKEGKYNTMIVKSLSRFGRNQRQCLSVTHELMECGCRCVFLEDNIDTRKDVSLIGLLLWLAENESRATSKRISYIYREHFDKIGRIHVCTPPYGYDYCMETKNFIVNEKEKEGIITIFDKYVNEGWGCTKIARYLNETNVPSKRGGRWFNQIVRDMLRNHIYIGTLVQGKTSKIDVTVKKRKENPPEEWIYHENRVEPIIDKETFDKAQLQLKKRYVNKRNRESTSSLFSNLIKCGECNSSFSIKRKKRFNNYMPYYECIEYSLHGTKCGHSRIFICEYEMIEILKMYFEEYSDKYDEIMAQKESKKEDKIDYDKLIRSVNKEIEDTVKKSNKLLDLLMNETISDVQYKLQNKSIDDKINELSVKKDELLLQKQEYELNSLSKNNTKGNIEKLLSMGTDKWTNQLLKSCIERIVIDGKKNVDIVLK